MPLNTVVWPMEEVLAVAWGWAEAGEWEAEEVQVPAGAGHNIMLNAGWIADFLKERDVIRWKDISEAMRRETD